MRFIEVGVLPAVRRGTKRTAAQGGDQWLIMHEAVRTFVCQFPEEIDLAKVEKFWFLELVTDGRIRR
jgi:hypothetical protein